MFQSYYNNRPCTFNGINPQYRNSSNIRKEDDRGLLLPFLAGAALAFPIGYIASNTNKYNYQQPYYAQPMPYYGYPMMQPYYNPYYY